MSMMEQLLSQYTKIQKKYPVPSPLVGGELFLATYGYAYPEENILAEDLMSACRSVTGNTLLIFDRIPMAVIREDYENLTIITQDLASKKTAEQILGATVLEHLEDLPQEERFDQILLLTSLSDLPDWQAEVIRLQQLLKTEGRLYLLQENQIGFHRLGWFLMKDVRNGVAAMVDLRMLKHLHLDVEELEVRLEEAPYEDLLALLSSHYPANKAPMRNTLMRRCSVFIVKGGPAA